MVKTCVIIGLGGHARNSWLQAVNKHPDWKLTGVVDTNTELLENVPKLTGLLKDGPLSEDQAYISIEDCIQLGTKPDLAIIATPIYTHHVLVKDCMDNGINVICEKNMATNINQGRQMLQLAIDHPELCTAVGNQYRFFIPNWTAHKYLQGPDNQIGKLAFVKVHESFNWGGIREGWRRWLQDLNIEDQAVHFIDLIRYITGMDVVQVKADVFIPNFSDWQGSSTTLGHFALARPEDYQHRRKWTWVEYYSDWQRRGEPDFLYEFSGDRGRFVIDSKFGGLHLWLYTDKNGTKWEEDFYPNDRDVRGLGNGYEGQAVILEQMSKGIDSKGKVQPDTCFKEAFKSFAVTMACLESSRLGQSVWVPDYWKDMPL
jgi:predicted dehydrogenase